MEVEIISREIIRPAAFQMDHHEHQETCQLSVLDSYIGSQIYTPIILFYNTKKDQSTIPSLKLSLSKALARFPMLAGRIKGNFIHYSSSNEADNNGALFVEATVKASMADFLKTPNLEFLANLIPFPHIDLEEPLETALQVAAQVNFFSCGTGIAMGFSFLHKIIDGSTMSAFIKTWAASNEGTLEKLARGSYEASSSLFPAREISSGHSLISPETPLLVAQRKQRSSRRFVFDGMAVSNLKLRAKSQSVSNPTSVEAVTCFIWKYAMKAASTRKSLNKKEVVGNGEEASCVDTKRGSLLLHVVNMRKRIQPPLSEHDVGNIFWISRAYYEASNTDTNLGDLETILRQSFLEIINHFIPKATGDDGFETIMSSLHQFHECYAKGSSESFVFSSWCNMGLNTVNFGWNKPIWIATGGRVNESSIMHNMIVLMDRASGEGIEAWIALDDETMNLLENDIEFLEFASTNPGITVD